MRIIFGKELYEKTKNPLERLNEWYKRLDYFWGDAGIKDKDFSAFSEKYSTCPICNRKIERSIIIDLYFSKDKTKESIRKHLIELMNSSKIKHENIKIGIPCCNCFSKNSK